MKDYMYIGPTPSDEACAQVGEDNYNENARKECRAFIKQLKRQFGEPPEGAELKIKNEAHDFGSYLEVVVAYNADNETAGNWALDVANYAPTNWDKEALLSGELPTPSSHLDHA